MNDESTFPMIAVEGENITKGTNASEDTEGVYELPSACMMCKGECSLRIKQVDIPHFKSVIIMASSCDNCGYKSREVKCGGEVPDKGTKISLNVSEESDLRRSLIKSDTCRISIPELTLEAGPGILESRFTTVEGLLVALAERLSEDKSFMLGDTVSEEQQHHLQHVIDALYQSAETPSNYTLILDDPMSSSDIQNIYQPNPDPRLKIEEYERTFEQNEELGINHLLGEHQESEETYPGDT